MNYKSGNAFLIALLTVFFPGSIQAQTNDIARLIGDWRGESICIGNNPSCHDEQVIYHIAKSTAAPNALTLAADKIVNGRPEPMGTLEFNYDAEKKLLFGEFQTARYHGRWEFTFNGIALEGSLFLLPDKTVARRIRVKKDVPSEKSMTTRHATGTFEVKLTPQDDRSDDKLLGRMIIDKQWHGDLEGTSKGQMLTGGDVTKASAGYVAIEKFTGTLNRLKGTFILQHSATMTRGAGQLTITVVPDSGTDELQGLSGQVTIKIDNGKHLYDFDYTLPAKP